MSDSLTLNDACALIVDCEHKTAPESVPGQEYGYSIGTPSIRNGRIILGSAKRVDQSTFDAWTVRAVPQKNDIILTREAPAGEAGLVDGTVPVCLGQRTVLLRPNTEVIFPRYLHYKLIGPDLKELIASRSEGSTVAHLNVQDIRRLSLGEVPKISGQEAIASTLGALDDRIAVNDRAGQVALELAVAMYDRAAAAGNFTHAVSMGDSARWLSGGTPDTSEETYWDGEIPWISALSLKSPWVDDSDRRVTALGAANGTRLVPKDTILFVVRGSSLDTEFRVGLTQQQVAFGQDCKALIANKDIDPAVLFLAIKARSAEILQLVDHTGHGAGRLSTDLISKVVLALPDEHLAPEVAAELRPLVEIGSACRAENRSLQQLRDTLLPKLMSGEIRVRDAEKVVEKVT